MINFIFSLPWYGILGAIVIGIPIIFVLFIWFMMFVLSFIVSRLQRMPVDEKQPVVKIEA